MIPKEQRHSGSSTDSEDRPQQNRTAFGVEESLKP